MTSRPERGAERSNGPAELSDLPRGFTETLLRISEVGTTTIRELEGWAGIARERMRKVVETLEERCLVERGTDGHVFLTSQGREVAARLTGGETHLNE